MGLYMLFLLSAIFFNNKTLLNMLYTVVLGLLLLVKQESSWGMIMDKMSSLLVMLSVWLFLLFFFMMGKYKKKNFFQYKITISFMFIVVCFTFFMKNIFLFYVFFEISLIPLTFLIFGWGYQVERVQAAFYLFVYTIVGSLPLLLVFIVYKETLEWFSALWHIFFVNYCGGLSYYLFFFVCFGLLIKLPVFIFHLWLPKAHVEAPVMGSMVLAAVMLKMSMYGIYRLFPLFKENLNSKFFFLSSFLIYGAIIAAIIAIRQPDMKSLVAFSSISHMGVMVGLLFSSMNMAVKAAIIVALSHGFCSSALFFLVNTQYEVSATRQSIMLGGFIFLYVGSGFWWFLFNIVNFSAPPFLNFFGEIYLLIQSSFIGFQLLVMALMAGFFVSLFSILLFSVIVLGEQQQYKSSFLGSDLWHTLLVFHTVPAVFLFMSDQMLFF